MIFKITNKKSNQLETEFINTILHIYNFNYRYDELENVNKMLSNNIELINKNIVKFINEEFGQNYISLEAIEKLVIILKGLYESGYENIITDDLYDKMLIKFKEYRAEPIEHMRTHFVRAETNVTHDFPELKGTLDKCHKIYGDEDYNDSIEKFIDKVFESSNGCGVQLSVSLKYDGVSCTFTVNKNGEIVRAITRGEDGKGVDLTELFRDLRFNRSVCKYFNMIGVQTELMMTNSMIERYRELTDKNYANSRTAVTSILTSENGFNYRKMISPVPIKVVADGEVLSVKENNNFKFGIDFISTEIKAYSKEEAMECIESLISESLDKRYDLGFAIDGIVISVLDNHIIEKLGRKDNINKYQIAYKFPSEAKTTIVRGVSYHVGRTGLITPLLHYDTVKFNGTNQTKCTLSSAKRLNDSNIGIGDTVSVVYSNDVIPYFDCVVSRCNSERIKVPRFCPCCGAELVIDGARLFCLNESCIARREKTFTKFIQTIGFKNFSESFIVSLLQTNIIRHKYELFDKEKMAIALNKMGYSDNMLTYKNYMKEMNKVLKTKITKSRISEAVGILGEKTCKQIYDFFSFDNILKLLDDESIMNKFINTNIPGVGDKTKIKFKYCLKDSIDDLKMLVNILNVKDEVKRVYSKRYMFTGFRDKELKEKLENLGIEVVENKALTKIDALVIKDNTVYNKKVEDARRIGLPIYLREEL